MWLDQMKRKNKIIDPIVIIVTFSILVINFNWGLRSKRRLGLLERPETVINKFLEMLDAKKILKERKPKDKAIRK